METTEKQPYLQKATERSICVFCELTGAFMRDRM